MTEPMRTPLSPEPATDAAAELAASLVAVQTAPISVRERISAPRRVPALRAAQSLPTQSVTAKLARAPARRKSNVIARSPKVLALETATPLCLTSGGPARVGLAQTIEGEVIPRLMLALKGARPSDAFAPLMPTEADIAMLAADVLGHDETAGHRFVDAIRARGMALEMIYIHLIAPTARRLGQYWSQDDVDFTAVTIGLGRLQQIVRRLSPSFRVGQGTLDDRSVTRVAPAHRSALIAPDCGEQHTLGCVMVEDFFTRSGWAVTGWPLCRDTNLVDMVRDHHFDLVGLSVGCDRQLGSVTQHIAALRRASRNRSLLVMVGGRTFSEAPTLAALVGADGTGASGSDAVRTAELMMTRQVEGA